MSTEIDRRVVEMEFDNKQFEEGVHTSVESLDKLKKSLNLDESVKSLDKLDRAGRSFNLRSVMEAADAVSHRFTLLGNLTDTVFTRISNTAINAFTKIKNVLDEFTIDPIRTGLQEYETQINSVQTILANTRDAMTKSGLNDQERLSLVNDRLDELNHYADKTIYNFTQMTESIGRFTAAGVELDPSVNAIQGIANLAALSGANAEQAGNAMYMLSQAISTGQTQLYHWNSIVRASMGGEITQQALMKVADTMGITVDRTIEEVDAGGKKIKKTVKRTARELMDIEGMSFRDTLQTGWLSGEVWTKTLGLFAMDFEEMAKKTNLGEEEKQSLIDQYVAKFIGQGDDATTALRKAQKVVEDATNLSEEQVKAMMKAKLISEGYSEADAQWFVDLAQEGGEAAKKVKTFTQLFDTLREAAQSGWTQSWEYIIGDFYEAKEFLTGVSEFFEGIISSSAETRNLLLSQWKEKGGRDLLFNKDPEKGPLGALWNLIYGFQNIAKAIRSGLQTIFPPSTAETLLNITNKINEITVKFREFTENSAAIDRIKRIAAGIASVFSIVRQVLSSAWMAIKRIFGVMSPYGEKVFEWIATIGDKLVALDQYLKSNNTFDQAIENVFGFIKDVVSRIKDFGSVFTGLFSSIKEWMSGNTVLESLGNFLTGIIDRIKQFISQVDGADLAVILSSILGAGMAIKVISFIRKLNKVKNTVVKTIKNVGEGITEALGSFKQKTDVTKPILNIAASLALIAGALFIISKIDRDRVWESIAVLGIMLAGLTGIVFLMSKIKLKNAASITAASSGLILLGAAMLIMSNALLIIGGLDLDAIKNGLLGIGGILLELAAFMALTTKTKLGVFKSGALILLAVAVNMFANSISKIGDFNTSTVQQGLIGLGAILLELSAFLALTSKTKMGVFKGTALILLAVSVNMFADTIEKIGGLETDSIKKGIIGLGGVLLELAVFMALTTKTKLGVFKSTSLILLAVAVNMFADTISKIGQFDSTSLIRGIAGLGAVLLELALFMALTTKTKLGVFKSTSLILLAVSVNMFADVISKIGGYDTDTILRGVIGIGAILAELAIFTNITRKAKFSILKGAGLVLLAVSVNMFADVIKKIGGFETQTILRGVIGLGAVMLEIATFLAITKNLKIGILKGVGLVLMAASLRIFAATLETIGSISTDGIIRGVLGLGAVLLEIAAFVAITQKLKFGALKGLGLILLATSIVTFAEAVSKVGKLKTKNVIQGIVGLGLVLIEVGAFTKIMGKVKISAIGKSLLGIVVMIGVLQVFIHAMKHLDGIDSTSMLALAESLSSILLSLSIAMKVISMIPITGAITGLVGFGILIAGVGGIMAGLGALQSKWGNMTSFLDSGGTILQQIGTGLGNFIGGIVGGFARSAINLPQIGTDLSAFMANSSGFVTGAKNVDSSVLTGVSSLCGAILAIAATEFLNGLLNIFNFFTGESSIDKFAQDINGIGTALCGYAESIRPLESVSDATFEKANKTALALSTLNSSLPRSGGTLQEWIGEKDLSLFAKNLPKVGTALAMYALSVSGMAANGSEADLEVASKTAMGLSQLNASLPRSGGLLQIAIGEKDLSDFSSKLPALALALRTYASEINGMSGLAEDGDFQAATDIAKGLAALAASLPQVGGSFEEIIGSRNLDDFSAKIPTLAKALVDYATHINGISSLADSADISAAQSVAEGIASVAHSLDRSGGFTQSIIGEKDLNRFSTGIVMLGGGMKQYIDSISGITTDDSDNAISIANDIVNLMGSLTRSGGLIGQVVDFFSGTKEETLLSYTSTMTTVGANLAAFCSSISGVENANTDNAFSVLTQITKFFENMETGSLWENIQKFFGLDSKENTLLGYSETMVTVGNNLTSFVNTVKGNKQSDTKETFGILDTIKQFNDDFKQNQSVWDSFKENLIGTGISNISADLATFGTNFSIFATGINGAAGVATNFAFVRAILESFANLAAAFENEDLGYVDISSVAGEIGQTFVTAFGDVIRDGGTTISAAEHTVLQIDAATIDSAYRQFYNSGQYLAEGLARGITSMAGMIRSSALAIASDAIHTLQVTWQIHSPSRVTTKMGEYFGQGSAIGISNTLKQMRKTVTNYAQVSLDELNNQWGGGLGRVQQTIQNGMSKLDLSDDAYGLALDLTGIGSGSSTTSKGPNGNPVGEEIGNSIADNVNAITSGGGVVVNFNDKNMVEHLNSIEDRIVELTELIDTMQMVLDTGELVGAMAGKMDSELGTLAMRRGRGN